MSPEFEQIPFRAERTATIDTLRWARKRFGIPVLLEVDVTAPRLAIRAQRRRTESTLSFTAWVIACVAQAVAEHPRVHALRGRRRQLVVFRDVDVAVVVERQLRGNGKRETLPMPVVIRKASEKSCEEISAEIRRAQTIEVRNGAASIEHRSRSWLQTMFFRGLPAWLRDLFFWRWVFGNAGRVKRTMGTVMVTATGMTAPGVLAWGIPLSVHPLAVSIGGIARRETPNGNAEILALTLVFDHAVIDGAPFGRFVGRLHELLTQPPFSTHDARLDAGRAEPDRKPRSSRPH